MTDQVHTNETPRGLLGFLGKIAGPKGFFGPGFWADFKEGYNASRQVQQHYIAGDGDTSFGNAEVESMWDDDNLRENYGIPYSPALDGQFCYTEHPSYQNPNG